MYSFLWRKLPGNRLVKSLIALGLVALVLVACYFWLFPWLDATFFPEPNSDL